MSRQIDRVISEFTRQAGNFNNYQATFSKEEYNNFAISNMKLRGDENVLEVAAGTCAFGRCVAPHVAHVTELDITEAMLNVGREQAAQQHIDNVSFIIGEAEHLPFPDASFDCVMSRLAFHHFADIAAVYAEMVRVLRPGGRLIVIDMRAREEALRDSADNIERLRDPSHARCVSEQEFRDLAAGNGLTVSFCDTIHIPVSVEAWMQLTNVQEPVKSEILAAMRADIAGQTPTGLAPYEKDGALYFDHLWMLVIAEK